MSRGCDSSFGDETIYTRKAHVYEPRILNTKDEMTIAVKKQLKQLQSKALKKIQGLNGIRTHDLRDTGPAL